MQSEPREGCVPVSALSIYLPVFLPYCPPIHQSRPGVHIMFNLYLDPQCWQELFLTGLYIISDTGGLSGSYR